MPTYQYRCTDCGRDLEVVQKFSDASLTVCPTCSGSLRKVFNAVGVVFKGSGFYRTDSRAAAGGSSDSGSSEKKSEKNEKSTESKPASADAGTSEKKTESSKPDKVSSNTSGASSSTGSKAATS